MDKYFINSGRSSLEVSGKVSSTTIWNTVRPNNRDTVKEIFSPQLAGNQKLKRAKMAMAADGSPIL